jgi:hypothetical protein
VRCATCFFCVDTHCRRYPPTVLVDEWTDKNGDKHREPEAVYPPVYPDDFCGEWKVGPRGES